MKDQKFFCSFPWGHLDIETNGDIKYCCASSYDEEHKFKDANGVHYNIHTHSIDEAWNSERIRNLRKKLYNGEKAPECKVCWKTEEIGGWSVRNAAKSAEENSYPNISHAIEQSAQNDFFVEHQPYFYQIQTGNLCNLACKMCHANYSTKYGEFYSELYADVSAAKYLPNNNHTGPDHRVKQPVRFDWPKSIGLTSIIQHDKLKYLTRLYLSGGEPTIIKENLDFLDMLVEKGYSKNINLIITTNITKIHPRFAEAIKHFKETSLICSMDSVGEPNEIQRFPTIQSTVDKNLQTYMELAKEHKNINISLNTVLTCLTLPYVDTILNRIIDYTKFYKVQLGSSALPFVTNGDLNISDVPSEVVYKTASKLKTILHNPENTHVLSTYTYNNFAQLIKSMEDWQFNLENDYTNIQEILNIIQTHHPDKNIKNIFDVYYRKNHA